jgi:hypothetical protein
MIKPMEKKSDEEAKKKQRIGERSKSVLVDSSAFET